MSTNTTRSAAEVAPLGHGTKVTIFMVLALAAFMLSYNYALAKDTDTYSAAPSGGLFAGSSGGACGCCGDSGPAVEGSTVVEGDTQRIAVDTSAGTFNPNVIRAVAGVPITLEFSQAPGGCLAGVYFPQFGINEDLTRGGKTVRLPALDPGEYTFYCQMQMISATIVVE